MKTFQLFFNVCKFSFIAALLTFTSCAKDGDIGPQGPAGTNGIDGSDGTNGTDGQNGTDGHDGEDGNANVSSEIFDITNMSWTNVPAQGFDPAYASLELNMPALNQEVMDGGLVLVYNRFMGEQTWRFLPITVWSGGLELNLNYSYLPSKVNLRLSNATSSSGWTWNGSIKVVVATADGLKTPEGEQMELDYANYLEVAEALGLNN